MCQNLFKVCNIRSQRTHEAANAVLIEIPKIQATNMIAERKALLRRNICTAILYLRIVYGKKDRPHEKQQYENDAVQGQSLHCKDAADQLDNRHNHCAEHTHVKQGIHTGQHNG